MIIIKFELLMFDRNTWKYLNVMLIICIENIHVKV